MISNAKLKLAVRTMQFISFFSVVGFAAIDANAHDGYQTTPHCVELRGSPRGYNGHTWFNGPNEADKLFQSAIHKQAAGNLPGAIADYLAAINKSDKDPSVHWYLATAYEKIGKNDEAQIEFKKSLANSPEDELRRLRTSNEKNTK